MNNEHYFKRQKQETNKRARVPLLTAPNILFMRVPEVAVAWDWLLPFTSTR
jgi:hypothetical protein